MMEILVLLLFPAAGALCWLGSRLYRLRRELLRERRENLRLRQLVSLGSQEASAELKAVQKLWHDLRHYLQMMDGHPGKDMGLAAEWRQALERPMPSSGESWGIVALIRYYEERAEELGITADLRLETGVLREGLLPDVCLVLSNLLENAVEALQREGGGWLRARCRSTQGYLSLVVVNSSSAPLKSVNGRYLSSKAEGRFGIGLATVQDIARRYGGQAEFTSDGQQFRASVFLPLPTPTEVPEDAGAMLHISNRPYSKVNRSRPGWGGSCSVFLQPPNRFSFSLKLNFSGAFPERRAALVRPFSKPVNVP